MVIDQSSQSLILKYNHQSENLVLQQIESLEIVATFLSATTQKKEALYFPARPAYVIEQHTTEETQCR